MVDECTMRRNRMPFAEEEEEEVVVVVVVVAAAVVLLSLSLPHPAPQAPFPSHTLHATVWFRFKRYVSEIIVFNRESAHA